MSKKEKRERFMDTDNSTTCCVVTAMGRGIGELEAGIGGINGAGQRLNLGICVYNTHSVWMHCRTVHLKPVLFYNQCHPN